MDDIYFPMAVNELGNLFYNVLICVLVSGRRFFMDYALENPVLSFIYFMDEELTLLFQLWCSAYLFISTHCFNPIM